MRVSVRRVGYVLASLGQPALRQLIVLGAPGVCAVEHLGRSRFGISDSSRGDAAAPDAAIHGPTSLRARA